jgi:hypothetical protein
VAEDWILENFVEAINEWLERDEPPVAWFLAVLDWTERIRVDPFRGGSPDREFGEPFWSARIPGATDGVSATICVYTVNRANHSARCSAITSLQLPW